MIHEPLARLALRHPIWFSLSGALIGTANATFRLDDPKRALIWGGIFFVIMLICWMPPYGPLRRLLQRYIDE